MYRYTKEYENRHFDCDLTLCRMHRMCVRDPCESNAKMKWMRKQRFERFVDSFEGQAVSPRRVLTLLKGAERLGYYDPEPYVITLENRPARRATLDRP